MAGEAHDTSKSKLSHFDEYKILREELMSYKSDIARIEMLAAVSVGSIYVWLLTHQMDLSWSGRLVWFTPCALIVVCFFRCYINMQRIIYIAEYLRVIEAVAFENDKDLPGWERHLKQKHSRLGDFSNRFSFAAWAIIFLLSVWFSLTH